MNECMCVCVCVYGRQTEDVRTCVRLSLCVVIVSSNSAPHSPQKQKKRTKQKETETDGDISDVRYLAVFLVCFCFFLVPFHLPCNPLYFSSLREKRSVHSRGFSPSRQLPVPTLREGVEGQHELLRHATHRARQ